MKVEIVNKSKHNLPQYATLGSAGMDLKADTDTPITLKPFERQFFPTGLYIALPTGYEAQIRSRSGLGCKFGVVVAQGVGTIDSDYRGEIKVCLYNSSNESRVIVPGERIAQMVIAKYERAEWEEVKSLDETERGEGGFGSTGSK